MDTWSKRDFEKMRSDPNGLPWDDLRLSSSAISLTGANTPTPTAFKGGYVLAFSTSPPNEAVYFNIQLPHEYAEGTDINPHLHWVIPTAGAGGGAENIKWTFTYSWANKQVAFPTESSSSVTIDVQNTPANTHFYTDVGWMKGNGRLISSMAICSLTRDVSVANDYTHDIYLLEFDFHYQKDKLGTMFEEKALPKEYWDKVGDPKTKLFLGGR